MKRKTGTEICLRILSLAFAAVMLIGASGCGLITISDLINAISTDAPSLSTQDPGPNGTDPGNNGRVEEKKTYSVSFDPDEVFPDELSKEAAELIDVSIMNAVALMNSLGDRFIKGEPEFLDYSTLPKERSKIKDELALLFYDEIERCASRFLDYTIRHDDYNVDLFYPIVEATDALRIDRPDLYLYCHMKRFTEGYQDSYKLAYYMPNEWLTKTTDDIEAVKRAVDVYYKVVDRIIAKMPAGLDNYEKCCYFAFLIASAAVYEDEQASVFDFYQAYNVLVKHEAVCKGYADAFLELCKHEGILCKVITGEAPGGGRHAWNMIEADGTAYYIDVTWFDVETPSADYRAFNQEYLFMTEEDLLWHGYVPD
ncbi:MAG: hypothetical protein J6112_00155 [Clostridia bacterium]|nr:hypothetical protein [Clostridia bacterium]